MKVLQAITQAMIDNDVAEGHIGQDAPVWGRYEANARVALLMLKQHFSGTLGEVAIDSILKGES